MNKFYCLVLLLFISGCTKDSQKVILNIPPGCDSTALSFSNDIQPIISKNCVIDGCHVIGSGTYDYSSYEVLADRIRSGRLEHRIDLPLSDPQHMPKDFELNACDYYRLKTWIHQGFPNN